MFRNVLVPSDLTDRTGLALETAANITATDRARITVLHVVETIPGAEFDELSSFYHKLHRQASARLHDLVSRTLGNREEVGIEILFGKRVAEVLRFVRENDVDLVVLASHLPDRSQPHGALGTMSYQLGILAPCAVLLIK